MTDNEKRIRSAIDQLYEHEGLTDALVDSDAKMLLAWGERQIKDSLRNPEITAEIDEVTRQVGRVIRTINRLIENKSELSESQMIQRLLRLVVQSMQLADQKAIANIEPQLNRNRDTNDSD